MIDRVDVTEQENRSAMTVAFQWLERSITTMPKLRQRLPPPPSRSSAPGKTQKRVRSEPNMRVAWHTSTGVVEGRRWHDANSTSKLRHVASANVSLRLGTHDVSSTSLLSGLQRQKSMHRFTIVSPVTQPAPQQSSTQATAPTPTRSRSSTSGPYRHIHHPAHSLAHPQRT